jgi:hypothetical protein
MVSISEPQRKTRIITEKFNGDGKLIERITEERDL